MQRFFLSWALAAVLLVNPMALATASAGEAGETAARVSVEAAGGLVATALTTLLAGAMFAVADPSGPMESFGTGLGVGLAALSAAVFAVPAGIYAGGELMGGDSNYWVTMVGALGGGLLGGTIAGLSDIEMAWGVTIIAVCVLGGGILAYELANEQDDDLGTRGSGLMAPVPGGVSGPFVVPLDRGGVVGFGLGF